MGLYKYEDCIMGFKYDYLIEKKTVLCGPCALARNGLITYSTDILLLQSSYEELDFVNLVYMEYWYYTNIDYSFCVKPSEDNPLILVPTKERAIVDYLRNEKHCVEGILIEALKTYLLWFKNLDELYRVCEHFDVSRDLIDYWIYEAEHDEEI